MSGPRVVDLRATLAFVLFASLGAGCRQAPEAYGEAVVVVATDVDVARFATRLRIDVFDDQLDWIDFKDIGVPEAATDWPVSFSVQHPGTDGSRVAWVRLRAYVDGNVRDYLGDVGVDTTPWQEPTVATSASSLCAGAPTLTMGADLTLRRGPSPITTTSCAMGGASKSGSAAANVHIATAGKYTFGIVASSPEVPPARPTSDARSLMGVPLEGDATLTLRTDCSAPKTELACAAGPLPSFTLDLAPGDYTLVTGGASASYADLTLRANLTSAFAVSPTPGVSAASPRLVVGGQDVTPATEPTPQAAIDRLVGIELVPGDRGRLSVVLTGDCFGVPASVSAQTSCVDGSTPSDPITPAPASEPISRESPPFTPWSGEQSVPCTGAPRSDAPVYLQEICIPGGAFTLGDQLSLATSAATTTQPQRVRVLSPFYLDAFEVTVARWRSALAAGFTPPAGGAPYPDPSPTGFIPTDACTWSSSKIDASLEALPINCLGWDAARAFCQFEGGDLPSEEQWEYAARAAGREIETQYPWGDDVPTCEQTVFGRTVKSLVCMPFGPVAVDAAPSATFDLTPLGVAALGGSVAEWTLDGLRAYDDPRWETAGLRGPLPFEVTAPLRTVRGAGWDGQIIDATSSTRRGFAPTDLNDEVGFRCARVGGGS